MTIRSALSSACLAAALIIGPAAAPALAQPTEDPNLEQTVTGEEKLVDDEAVLDAGHVDIGPKQVGSEFQLVMRDDTEAPPVWRSLDKTVLKVNDAGAKMPMPEDEQYSFIGAKPGEDVWLIPQVEKPGLIWVGWNTQDPAFTQTAQHGMNLEYHGMQGPGDMVLYLQNGSFGEPEQLWDSRKGADQKIFVENNTHTHANWVFTKPGVYLLDVGVSFTDASGNEVSSRQVLRLAVGDAASTDEAMSAEYTGGQDSGDGDAAGKADADAGAEAGAGSGADPLMFVLLGVGAVLLVVAAIAVIGTARAKKRAAAAQDSSQGTGQ